jgi:hypothetical protein
MGHPIHRQRNKKRATRQAEDLYRAMEELAGY